MEQHPPEGFPFGEANHGEGNPLPLFITFVLDETSSMHSIAGATIEGFNSYVREIRSTDPQAQFTLVRFNTQKLDRSKTGPLSEVRELTAHEYNPIGGTPLIDAVATAIRATEEEIAHRKVRAIVVVQTDGEENSSRRFSKEQLKSLIEEKQRDGWAFVFLGAGIDAFHGAEQLGFQRNTVMSYDRTKSPEVFRAASRSTISYASSGLVADASFTKGERMSVDEHNLVEGS